MASRGRQSRLRSVDRMDPPYSSDIASQPLYLLIEKLLQKDAIPQPRLFHKRLNIVAHVKSVDRYLQALNISQPQSKTTALLNSLDEEVQTELFAQPGYESHENEYTWLCSTLINLYQKKRSTVSPLLHLFSIKQKPHQTFSSFATELRVEAYRCWPAEDSTKKEESLVRAFLNGLLNKDVALAIQSLQPDSLEEALRLVVENSKEEDNPPSSDKEDEENHVRVIQKPDSSTQDLKNQVLLLQQQVTRLENMFTSLIKRFSGTTTRQDLHNRRSADTPRPQFQPQRRQNGNPIVCFNCNQQGHIARNCSYRQHSRGTKPVTRTDRREFQERPRGTFLRQMQSNQTEDSLSINSSLTDADEEEQGREKDFPALNAIMQPRQATSQRPKRYASLKDEAAAEAWSQYVYGKGKKPCDLDTKTLISESHSEPAENKPLIVGKCGGEKVKLFLDSGAEMNVIDHEFLGKLKKKFSVVFQAKKSQIQCANGSRMASSGSVVLPVQIDGVRAEVKFTVVRNLFPRIIIGIKTMKSMGIIMDTTNDCIIVGDDQRIPFVSRIAISDSGRLTMGKDRGLFGGAWKGPNV